MSAAVGQTSVPVQTKGTTTKVIGAPRSQFNQFSLDYSKILSDDYVHKKFLTVKYAGKGNRFNFSGKESLDFKLNKDKQETPAVSSEVKLVTNVEGRNIETKFDSRGLIRTWAHWGQFNVGKPFQLATKVKTNTAFDKVSTWACAEYKGTSCDSSLALHLKNGWVPFFNHKTIFRHGNFTTGLVTKVNLQNFTLKRYNAFVSYAAKDLTVYAEHVSRNQEKIAPGKFILAGLFRKGGNSYVARVSYRPWNDKHFRAVVGTHYKVNNKTDLRVKVDSNAKLALSTKFKVNDNLSVVGGSAINLTNPGSYLTNRLIPIPLGLSVEFSFN